MRFPLSTTCFIESFHNARVAVGFACKQGPGLNPTCQASTADSFSSLSCSNPTLESPKEAINNPGLTSKIQVARIEACTSYPENGLTQSMLGMALLKQSAG